MSENNHYESEKWKIAQNPRYICKLSHNKDNDIDLLRLLSNRLINQCATNHFKNMLVF